MRLTDTTQPFLLSYRARGEPNDVPALPGPLWPVLSTLPGLFCWLLFASAAMPRELPVLDRIAGLLGTGATSGVVLAAWGLGIATSIAALAYYGRRQQVWHTTLCLAVHLAGLLFSVLLVGGLLVMWVA